jgi:hypothetical protein
MKTEDLIEKYPKIFEPYEGNPGYINWFGVPPGWIKNVDKLCGCIQDYIDNTYRSELNPNYVQGSDEPKFNKIHPEQVRCIQMKEKHGTLRFYVSGADSNVNGMIKMAEYLCDNTCERCGSEKSLGLTKGWISVLCKKCAKELEKNWEPYKK